MSSITQEAFTISPGSSTPMAPSTSRHTRLTVLSSSLPLVPSLTVSHLHQSLPSSCILFYTTASGSGSMLNAISESSPISMLASCPFTRRFPIGGISPYVVRASFTKPQMRAWFSIFHSGHIRIRCHCHRSVGHATPYVGICAFPHHL
jgi:hypothetical protein